MTIWKMKSLINQLKRIIEKLEMLDITVKNNCKDLDEEEIITDPGMLYALYDIGRKIDTMEADIHHQMKQIYMISLQLGSDNERRRKIPSKHISLPS